MLGGDLLLMPSWLELKALVHLPQASCTPFWATSGVPPCAVPLRLQLEPWSTRDIVGMTLLSKVLITPDRPCQHVPENLLEVNFSGHIPDLLELRGEAQMCAFSQGSETHQV